MQPSTGQTRLHMLQPTHVSSLIVKTLITSPPAPGTTSWPPERITPFARAAASPGTRPCATRSQRIDWWQPSSQAM